MATFLTLYHGVRCYAGSKDKCELSLYIYVTSLSLMLT